MAFTRLAALVSSLVLAGVACATSHGGGGGKTSSTGGGQGGASDASSGVGLGGGTLFGSTGTSSGADGGRCDDAGHCTCMNIASLGAHAHYGSNNDNTDVFQAWLNDNSSAKLDLYPTRTTITADLLANYDVLLLQALEDAEYGPFWQFTQDEVDALTTWVNNGGGLITLSGYGGDADEVNPTNQLLQFAGISYNKDDVLGQCPGGENCYCWGNSIPLGGWAPASPISSNITQIGAFHGRSLNNTDGDVVCTDGTAKYAISKQVGKGRVFVFADEWVTYSSQWHGSGQSPPATDPCYNMTADKVFQVPQFWYNVIKWVGPDRGCFDIMDPGIIK